MKFNGNLYDEVKLMVLGLAHLFKSVTGRITNKNPNQSGLLLTFFIRINKCEACVMFSSSFQKHQITDFCENDYIGLCNNSNQKNYAMCGFN